MRWEICPAFIPPPGRGTEVKVSCTIDRVKLAVHMKGVMVRHLYRPRGGAIVWGDLSGIYTTPRTGPWCRVVFCPAFIPPPGRGNFMKHRGNRRVPRHPRVQNQRILQNDVTGVGTNGVALEVSVVIPPG